MTPATAKPGLTLGRYRVKTEKNREGVMNGPMHIWVVGLIALIWHAGGAYD